DEERAGDAARGPQGLEHGHVVQAAAGAAGAGRAAARAGSSSASSATGTAVSSGRRPMPIRSSVSPTAREAVKTANGIESARPAASGSANAIATGFGRPSPTRAPRPPRHPAHHPPHASPNSTPSPPPL